MKIRFLNERDKTTIDEKINLHISDESNPHKITKAKLGLDRVENKSSKDIRDEMTKENVTNALGYTPEKSGEAASILNEAKTYTDKKIEDIDVEVSKEDVTKALGYTPVSETRTINGRPLNADIVLSANDVGADPKGSADAVMDYAQKSIQSIYKGKVQQSYEADYAHKAGADGGGADIALTYETKLESNAKFNDVFDTMETEFDKVWDEINALDIGDGYFRTHYTQNFGRLLEEATYVPDVNGVIKIPVTRQHRLVDQVDYQVDFDGYSWSQTAFYSEVLGDKVFWYGSKSDGSSYRFWYEEIDFTPYYIFEVGDTSAHRIGVSAQETTKLYNIIPEDCLPAGVPHETPDWIAKERLVDVNLWDGERASGQYIVGLTRESFKSYKGAVVYVPHVEFWCETKRYGSSEIYYWGNISLVQSDGENTKEFFCIYTLPANDYVAVKFDKDKSYLLTITGKRAESEPLPILYLPKTYDNTTDLLTCPVSTLSSLFRTFEHAIENKRDVYCLINGQRGKVLYVKADVVDEMYDKCVAVTPEALWMHRENTIGWQRYGSTESLESLINSVIEMSGDGSSVTWDGNSGEISVVVGDMIAYRVADVAPTNAELSQGSTVTAVDGSGNSSSGSVTVQGYGYSGNSSRGIYNGEVCAYFIRKDSFSEGGVTFPKAGTYLTKKSDGSLYHSALTINNFTKFPQTAKIKKSALPDDIGGGGSITVTDDDDGNVTIGG